MKNADLEKRDFFKYSLLAAGSLFLSLSGIGKLVQVIMDKPDQIGILYSTVTGIVLRTINPDHGDQSHLSWLHENRPAGTTLLCLDKSKIGADEKNCPNMDFLIPYVKANHGLDLSFGKTCAVIDSTNTVIDVVLCCPVLYQAKLDRDAQKTLMPHRVIPATAPIGHIYNPITQAFTMPNIPVSPMILPPTTGGF